MSRMHTKRVLNFKFKREPNSETVIHHFISLNIWYESFSAEVQNIFRIYRTYTECVADLMKPSLGPNRFYFTVMQIALIRAPPRKKCFLFL